MHSSWFIADQPNLIGFCFLMFAVFFFIFSDGSLALTSKAAFTLDGATPLPLLILAWPYVDFVSSDKCPRAADMSQLLIELAFKSADI